MERRLYTPGYVKDILHEHGFKFSKGLGQNFLIDGNIVRGIASSAEITKDDYVLEIGPGIGTLTEELALNAKKVVSVEIDRELLPILDITLEKYDNVEIVHGDILKIDIDELIDEKLGGGPVKVVANLPYYVTTPIIARLIEGGHNIESITVMIQKEVADRIVADKDNKQYGSLSVFVNFYSEPEIVLDVPRTVFIPQPNVDSAVIRLKLKDDLLDVDQDIFFRLVKSAFGKRRKTILNSMSSGQLTIEKPVLKEILEDLDIRENNRAENLSIEDFARIANRISKL